MVADWIGAGGECGRARRRRVVFCSTAGMQEKEEVMNLGLQLKYLWHDVDVFEIEAVASNGKFSGASDAYVSIGGLAEAAETVKGFPRDLSDVREFEFGAFGRESAGGAVHVRFSCMDGAGHAVVELRFESEYERNAGSDWNRPAETANFFGKVEASAVDDFVAELRLLEENKSGVASLRFADLPTC